MVTIKEQDISGDANLVIPIHLIDLYPTIYLGHGKGPWNYDLPQ